MDKRSFVQTISRGEDIAERNRALSAKRSHGPKMDSCLPPKFAHLATDSQPVPMKSGRYRSLALAAVRYVDGY